MLNMPEWQITDFFPSVPMTRSKEKKLHEKLPVFKDSSKQLVGPMLVLRAPLIFVGFHSLV